MFDEDRPTPKFEALASKPSPFVHTINNVDLLMPNDKFSGGIVIASCWGNDDPEFGPVTSTILVLNDTPGRFYSVLSLIYRFDQHRWVIESSHDEANIVPASEYYNDVSGAW